VNAPYYNGAPGEMPYDDHDGRSQPAAVPVLGHCHDCAEDGELVPALRWWYDGLRELPMCGEHWRDRDNYEPRYDSGL
jgi:hypothetical protein